MQYGLRNLHAVLQLVGVLHLRVRVRDLRNLRQPAAGAASTPTRAI
jgi:hypothetical protein